MEENKAPSYDFTDYYGSIKYMKEVMSILEKTSLLIDTIKQSDIYLEYEAALRELKKSPELKARADAFREENYLAYHAIKDPVSFADFDSLEEERTELAACPQIERYLKAELALCRIIQEIQTRVISAMNFD